MSALAQMSRATARTVVRQPRTLGFGLVFPLLFVALFVFMDVVMGGGRPSVGVVEDPGGEVAAVLRQVDVDLRAPTPGTGPLGERLGSLDVVVGAPQGLTGDIAVVTSALAAPADVVADALVDAGVERSSLSITAAGGGEPFDAFRFGLAGVLLLSFAALALFGTAVPIIQMRAQGTLRLLGTTPLRRLTFLLAQAPVRLAMAAVQVTVLAGLALATGFLRPEALLRLLGTSALALALMVSLGFLLAARLRSPEIATQLGGWLLPVVLLVSGVLVPPAFLPDALRSIAQALPFFPLGDLLRQDLVGLSADLPRWRSVGTVVAWTLAATLLATKLFSWDQGDR